MIFIILISSVIVVLMLVLQVVSFNKTTYHTATGNSFFTTVSDKGKYGEYKIYRKLRHLEKQGAKFFFNVYLPKENGETTECDVILITHSGFIVFESKNYSGWIFGDEKSKTWTQTLPQGKGRPARKEKFFNPVMQNKLHIKYLKSMVGGTYEVRSIIVFSERCELKKVTTTSSEVQVVKRNNVASAVAAALNAMPQNVISGEEIDRLYEQLYPYSQADETVKQQHIQNIRKIH